jgi:hypothetical protein
MTENPLSSDLRAIVGRRLTVDDLLLLLLLLLSILLLLLMLLMMLLLHLVSSLLYVRVDRAIALDIARERSAGVDCSISRLLVVVGGGGL